MEQPCTQLDGEKKNINSIELFVYLKKLRWLKVLVFKPDATFSAAKENNVHISAI